MDETELAVKELEHRGLVEMMNRNGLYWQPKNRLEFMKQKYAPLWLKIIFPVRYAWRKKVR